MSTQIGAFDVDLLETLGKGAFGIVYSGQERNSGKRVTVKCVIYKEKGQLNETLVNMGKTEQAIFNKLKGHPNVVQLLDHVDDGKKHWLVMEFCELGDLPEYMKAHTIDISGKLKIMLDTSKAVAYMHSFQPAIVHRDIKPTNIMIVKNNNQHVAKITDFGVGKLYEENPAVFRETMTTFTGTAAFLAPEFWSTDKDKIQYRAGVDTFALGLVFHLILDFDNNHDMVPASSEYIIIRKSLNLSAEIILLNSIIDN